MKIRLIESDNKIVCESENTDILSILSIENMEIQIQKEDKLLIFKHECSAYNVTENVMDIHLNLIDIDNFEGIREHEEFNQKDLKSILKKWSIK